MAPASYQPKLSVKVMNKRKEKNSTAPTLEDTVRRLETRLREFEDRSGKKIKDLENLVEYLTNKVICKLQIFTFTIYRMSAAPLNIDTYICIVYGVSGKTVYHRKFSFYGI